MKSKNKAGFGVNDKPEVMFLAIDFHNSFIGMPLIGVKV